MGKPKSSPKESKSTVLLNEIKAFSFRAKIETLLNAKSCQSGPGLAAIVINNLLGEDQGERTCVSGKELVLTTDSSCDTIC